MLLVDKPAGVTSHDVVAGVRRGLERRVKVGHGGTLDPFATGLLLVLVGRATRVQRFLLALEKEYVVEARFGAVSTTADRDGEITETGRVPEGELELPVGRLRQRPPAYSAVHVDGVRAYKRARRGEEVEVPEREVEVSAFEELVRDGAERTFRVACGSGTYIRSLVADLGDAYCTALRRTRVGPFRVEDADRDRLVTLEDGLAFLPEVALDEEEAQGVGHGRPVARRTEDPVVRLTHAGAVLALAEPREDLLRPVVVLRPGGT